MRQMFFSVFAACIFAVASGDGFANTKKCEAAATSCGSADSKGSGVVEANTSSQKKNAKPDIDVSLKVLFEIVWLPIRIGTALAGK